MDTITVYSSGGIIDTFKIPNTNLNTGEYVWQVASYPDTGGISQFSLPLNFRIDIEAPSILSVSPQYTTNIPNPTIVARYNDNFSGINLYKCILILDNDTLNAQASKDSIWFNPPYNLSEIEHEAKVIAYDSANNRVEYSWSFKVDYTAPNAPSLLFPNQGSFTNKDTIILIWSRVNKKSTAVKYRCLLSTTPDFQNVVLDSTSISDTTLRIVNINEGLYYWKICPYDEAGNIGECSDFSYFTIDRTPPSAPILIYPSRSAYINTVSPVFCWSSSFDNASISYHFYLSLSPYKDEVIFDTTLTDTVLNLPFQLEERKYFWNVISEDIAGNSSNNDLSINFTVDTTSPKILYTSIRDTFYQDTSLNLLIIFKENNSLSVDSSFITLNSEPLMFTIISDSIKSSFTSSNSDSITLNIHLEDKAHNYTETTIDFGIDDIPPQTPILITPKNHDTIIPPETTLAFIWSKCARKSPVKYHFQCSLDSLFQFTLIDSVIEDTSLTIDVLPENYTYYWRVQAFDMAGNFSDFSEYNTFTISTSQITLDNPSHDTIAVTNLGKHLLIEVASSRTPIKRVTFRLYNIAGRLVFCKTFRLKGNHFRYVYNWKSNNGSKLHKGIYYYEIISDNNITSKGKVIKLQ